VFGVLDVQVKTSNPVVVAYLSMRGPYDQIPEAMGRLYSLVAQRGLQPDGMPAGVYLDDPQVVGPQDARWELQAPLAGDPAETSEPGFGIKRVAPHLVASAMYRGSYDKIGPAYMELAQWIGANGYDVVGPSYELYLSDPETTAPEDYLTEIRFPIAPR
jgi:AraC family transcriptional regulator